MKKRFLAILLIILPAIITFAQDNYESGVLLLQVKQPHIVSLDNTKVINGSAEYHFTPYGKEGFCNFGADSLVEYAFGLFSNGWVFPDGTIIFTFAEGTPPTRIDSLFAANGLQLLRQHTDFTSGKIWYTTLVTPRSKKNVLDLGYELQAISFVIFADVPLNIAWVEDGPVDCNK